MTFIPNLPWGRCVRMLAVLLGMLHVSFIIVLINLSNFSMSSFGKRTAWYAYAI